MRGRVQDQGGRFPDCDCALCLGIELTPAPFLALQGFFGGSYNAVGGKIKGPKGDVGELSGHWHDMMELQRKGVSFSVPFGRVSGRSHKYSFPVV